MDQGSKMSSPLTYAAEELGLTSSYFFVLKNQRKDLYAYLESICKDDIAHAYRTYESQQDEVRKIVTDLYYEYDEREDVPGFYRWLVTNGFYDNVNSARASISKVLFRSEPGFHKFSTFLKYREIAEKAKEASV